MAAASFNQDASCLAVATRKGYRIYNCNPFGRFFSADDGAVGLCEMLFATSLVAVVGQGEDAQLSPRRLRIVNTKKRQVICELTFPTTIVKVLMNRKRVVVALEDQIYIYDIQNMRLLHTMEISMNPTGIVSLSTSRDSNILVYPSGPPAKHVVEPATINAETGDVTVFDLDTFTPLNVIKAHRNALALAQLNSDGTLLATVSEKGTLIRIFSVPSGTLLHEFRRGSFESSVYCVAFNLSSTLVCVSSSTQTVHIYRLNKPQNEEETEEAAPPKKHGYTYGFRKKVGKAVRDQRGRGFAWFKLPTKPGTRSTLAIAPLTNIVYVATASGTLYHYSINMEKGGECERVADYQLLN